MNRKIMLYLLVVSLTGLQIPQTEAAAAPGYTKSSVLNEPVQRVQINNENGTPAILSGQFQTSDALSFIEKTTDLIDQQFDQYKIERPASEFDLISEETDNFGKTHVRFQQVLEGLRVWGCQTIIHFENEETIYMVG